MHRLVVSSFWNNWWKNCLSILQLRTKWKRASRNLSVRDVIIIKKNLSPYDWPLGVVIDMKPNLKDHLRMVTVWSKGTELQKSVQRFVKLPTEESMVD